VTTARRVILHPGSVGVPRFVPPDLSMPDARINVNTPRLQQSAACGTTIVWVVVKCLVNRVLLVVHELHVVVGIGNV
jgi:hypothetical protein